MQGHLAIRRCTCVASQPASLTWLQVVALVAVAVVSAALLFGGSAVSAQQPNTPARQAPPTQSALAVSPAITEQVLTPGAPVRTVVRVTNITRIPLPIKSSVRNLTLGESLLPDADKDVYDASEWFTVEPADFILQPNQTKEVAVSILPPARATPGGHYATVYFQPLVPTEALSPSTAYLNARVGVLAFLIVRGDIAEKATLGDIALPRIKQFGPIGMKLPVHNEGNVHLLPQGKVTIRDFRGRSVGTMPLKTGMVLPKTVRDYTFSWDNKGRYGYFSAQAGMTYGTDQIKLQSSTVGFWILPWVPLLLTTILLALLIWFIMKTRKRWAAAWKALRGHDGAA